MYRAAPNFLGRIAHERWRWIIYYVALETGKDWVFGKIADFIEDESGAAVDVLTAIVGNPSWVTVGLIGLLIVTFAVIEARKSKLVTTPPEVTNRPTETASGAEELSSVRLALRLGEYEWKRPEPAGFDNIVRPNLHMLVRFDITEPIEIEDVQLLVADRALTPVKKSFLLQVSDSCWIKFVTPAEIRETLHTSSMRVRANGLWVDSLSGTLMYPTP